MTTHLMVDIETAGTEIGSAILSIGAVIVKDNTLQETFYETASLEDNQAVGLNIDASTMLWWMEQSEEARNEVFGSTGKLEHMLRLFNAFIDGYEVDTVWANAPTFDLSMIREAMKKVDMPPAWTFRQERCCRTTYKLFPIKIEREGVHHNALDDAIHQAKGLIHALKKIDSIE